MGEVLSEAGTPGVRSELSCAERICLRALLCPLFTQDLFFKYTWNNFLHFQVELCVAAILSHAAREERAEASGSESRVEPPQGSGNGNRSLDTPQPTAKLPENTMVTHVSPGQLVTAGGALPGWWVPAWWGAICQHCPALAHWLLTPSWSGDATLLDPRDTDM